MVHLTPSWAAVPPGLAGHPLRGLTLAPLGAVASPGAGGPWLPLAELPPATLNRPRPAKAQARPGRGLDHAFLLAGLHRFGEYLSGSPFTLVMFRNLLQVADPEWLLEVFFFRGRLQRLFSLARGKNAANLNLPSHPWYGGPQMIISSVCSRDPYLLTQWIGRRMATMRLFAHRRFLRLLGSFLRTYVDLTSTPTTLLGFHLVTTGKISVTGNAMSRTMLVRFGKAGVNNLSYRASTAFTLIRTKTGCLGLNLAFYY